MKRCARSGGLLMRKRSQKKRQVLSDRDLAREILQRYNAQKTTRVFVAGGSREGNNSEYAKEAFQLGRLIGSKNYQLTFGLSSKGITGAVAQGVLEAWKQKHPKHFKPILGITTEHYQKLYPDDGLLAEMTDVIVSHTLEERKQNLLSADFVVFAPGGLGTLDELVYDCIAMQDGLLEVKPFIFFNVRGFFHHLLEYLKDIQLKGFSDRMPFVVVDNVFEMEIAFSMFAYYRAQRKKKGNASQIVDKIIHELPYVIEQCCQRDSMDVRSILREKEHFLRTQPLSAQEKLAREIERAYLNKEIQRMSDRLISTNRDTALVRRKLDVLKERMKNTGPHHGFH